MRNHAKVLVVWDLALVLLVIDTVKYCQGSKFEGRPLFFSIINFIIGGQYQFSLNWRVSAAEEKLKS